VPRGRVGLESCHENRPFSARRQAPQRGPSTIRYPPCQRARKSRSTSPGPARSRAGRGSLVATPQSAVPARQGVIRARHQDRAQDVQRSAGGRSLTAPPCRF
jgi:hypothetical protein